MYETLSCTLHVLGLSAFQDTAKVLNNKSDVDLVGRDGEEGWQCGERGLLSQIKGITTTELACHAFQGEGTKRAKNLCAKNLLIEQEPMCL